MDLRPDGLCAGKDPLEIGKGGLFTPARDEFLCAACYRTAPHWHHLGPIYFEDAIRWVGECRAAGGGLPTAVVESFAPSEACLCSSGDCFLANLRKCRDKSQRRECIPCGTNKSDWWKTGGERAGQYQLYFTGERVHRTAGGMRKTKEVITFFFFFFFISLIADGPHHYHPACGHKGSSHLSPVHALQFFIAMQVQHSYNSSTNG